MKKKAGQAPNSVRAANIRSNELAPVSSNTPSRPRAASAQPVRASAQPVRASSGTRSSATGSNNVKSTVKTAKSTTKRVKAKKKSHAGLIIAIVLLVLVLGGGGAYGYLYFTGFFKPHVAVTNYDGSTMNAKAEDIYAQLNTNTFYTGTVIDGVEVGGMTVEQAVEAVEKSHSESPVKVELAIKLEDKEYPLDITDVKVEYNTKAVVDEAFAKFRPSNDSDLTQLTEYYNSVEQLKTTPMTFETTYTVQINGVSEKVHEILDPLADQFTTTKDAEIGEFDTKTKQFTITPEQVGMTLDIEGAIAAVNKLIESKTYSGVVEVPTVKTEPEVTTEKLNANFGLIGSQTTKASDNANRNNNLNQACKKINGLILKPGEEFSFNKVVGQRTTKNGFKEATVILGGQYEQGLGGGVCQVSSTLYNAVLKSDLKISERHPHAWPSGYVLDGLDATVDWPALDFKFKNSSDYPIVIVMWFESKDRTVHAEIYGKRFPDEQKIALRSEVVGVNGYGKTEYVEDKSMAVGKTKTVRQAHQGMTVKTYKIWQDKDGKEIKRDPITTTTYAAYGKRISVGTKNPDGTIAKFDPKTGQVSGVATATPKPTSAATPAPTKKADPTAAPTKKADPTPVPTKKADPTPVPTPDNGGGNGGGSEGGGGGNP